MTGTSCNHHVQVLHLWKLHGLLAVSVPARPAKQRHRPPYNVLQLVYLKGRRKHLDHGEQLCATTEMSATLYVSDLVDELADRNDFLNDCNWHRRKTCTICTTRTTTLSMDCKLRNLDGLQTDGTMGICLCATTGKATLSTRCSCVHQSLHDNGHVDDLQELHLEHCGCLSLRRNWNVQHSDDELTYDLDCRSLSLITGTSTTRWLALLSWAGELSSQPGPDPVVARRTCPSRVGHLRVS